MNIGTTYVRNYGNDIIVEYGELPVYDRLAMEWLDLEARSVASYFTSWSWIGCWLFSLPQHIQPRLLRVIKNNKVVALGLLVSRNFLRHNIIPVNGLFLNTTGDPFYDEITIEYNGFLIDNSLQPDVIHLIYEHLETISDDWDELHLDCVTETMGDQSQKFVGLQVHRHQEFINCVKLDDVRLSSGNYLSLLGNNTRYNIRRSIKEFEKLGAIKLSVARNVNEALYFLSGLKDLHQIYWRSKGLPGSFSNSFFELFHNRLIRSRFDSGEIQLIKICAGDCAIGYLYNFIHRNVVHNYQTGFDYKICKKQFSPGLVSHSLVIEYNATQGYRIYDLMAGDLRYKQMLGVHLWKLNWIVLRRDRLKFRLEERLRQIKHRLKCFLRRDTAESL